MLYLQQVGQGWYWRFSYIITAGKIIKDIEGTQSGIDTANFGIDTANAGIDNANSGISTLSLDVGTANQGIEDANEAIANIDCGSCDLTEVHKKLDKIIKDIPNMKCKFPRPNNE